MSDAIEQARFEKWAITDDGNCNQIDLRRWPVGTQGANKGETYCDGLVERDWIVWQAARAIPLAAAEPMAYLAEDDEGNVGLGRTVRHAMRSCEPGATVTPLIRASIAAPDRAPSTEPAMCDDGGECGAGGYCITCPHVPAPSTDSATGPAEQAAHHHGDAESNQWVTSDKGSSAHQQVATLGPAVLSTDSATERDAARWQWLKNNALTGSLGFGDGWIDSGDRTEWDAEIDSRIAAMKGEATAVEPRTPNTYVTITTITADHVKAMKGEGQDDRPPYERRKTKREGV